MMTKSRQKAHENAQANMVKILKNNSYLGTAKLIAKISQSDHYDNLGQQILIQGQQKHEIANIWTQQVILISTVVHNYYLRE